MEWYIAGILMIVVLIVLSLMNIPLAVCLGLTAVGFLGIGIGFERTADALNAQFFDMWSSFPLLAIPLFIFMGEFMFAGGITGDLFDMASKWFQRLPGGLSVVTIAACAVFAAMSGSSIGAVATFGVLAVPEMLNRGYDRRLAAGAVAAAGPLAHLIPPSIMAVLYAMLVGVSPGKQLMAGFIPGLVLATVFIITVFIWTRFNPSIAPKEPAVSWRERFRVLSKIGGPLVIIIAVLGVLYTGVATVTESAAIGALASVILAIASRRLSKKTFFGSLLNSAKTTAFVLLIAVGGKFFGWVLNYYTVPQHLVDILVATGWNRWVMMVMIQLMFIVLGMFIDPVGIMFTTVPILYPLLIALDFNLIWFGVLFLINMELAMITPPVGFSLYIIKGIVGDRVPLSDIISGSLRFSSATVVVLALVMAFPQIALWIPNQMTF